MLIRDLRKRRPLLFFSAQFAAAICVDSSSSVTVVFNFVREVREVNSGEENFRSPPRNLFKFCLIKSEKHRLRAMISIERTPMNTQGHMRALLLSCWQRSGVFRKNEKRMAQ